MDQQPADTTNKSNILVRGLFMFLMGVAFHLTGTLLFMVAVIQFVFALVTEAHNPRLAAFGRSLGIYARQNADFLSFVTEEKPFPFSDWPS